MLHIVLQESIQGKQTQPTFHSINLLTIMHLVASSYSVIIILILWVWVGPPLLPSAIYDATALNYYSI